MKGRQAVVIMAGAWFWEYPDHYEIVLEDNYQDPCHDFTLEFTDVMYKEEDDHFYFYRSCDCNDIVPVSEMHRERFPDKIRDALMEMEEQI